MVQVYPKHGLRFYHVKSALLSFKTQFSITPTVHACTDQAWSTEVGYSGINLSVGYAECIHAN